MAIKYAVEQRLRLIDFLIFHYGHVNRSALQDYFGISSPQASRDIQDYMKLAPKNIEYSTTDKTYKPTDKFKRLFS